MSYRLHAVPQLHVVGGLGPVGKDAGGASSLLDSNGMVQVTVLGQRKLVLVTRTDADGYPVGCLGKGNDQATHNFNSQ